MKHSRRIFLKSIAAAPLAGSLYGDEAEQDGATTNVEDFSFTTEIPKRLITTPRVSANRQLAAVQAAEPTLGSVISAAYFSFTPQVPAEPSQAPGSLISIFGTGLASQITHASGAPWTTSMGDVSVSINGRQSPLHYVSPAQINAQVPYETELGNGELKVTNAGVSKTIPLRIAERSPYVFGYGTGFASALRIPPNGTPLPDPLVGIGPGNPAMAGDIISLYFTGAGKGNIAVPTGHINPGDLRDRGQVSFIENPSIRLQRRTPHGIEALDANILATAKAPNFIGLDQVNFQLPQDMAPGMYTVELLMQGRGAAAVDLAVLRNSMPYTAGRITTIGRDFGKRTVITMGGEEFSPSARGHILKDRTTVSEQDLELKVEGDDHYGFQGRIVVPAGDKVKLPQMFSIPKLKDPNLKYRFDANVNWQPSDGDPVYKYLIADENSQVEMLDLLHFSAIYDNLLKRPGSAMTLWRWNQASGPIKIWLDEEHAYPGIAAKIRSVLGRWHHNGQPWFVEVDYDPTKRLDDNGVRVMYGVDEYGNPNPNNAAGAFRRADGTWSGNVSLLPEAIEYDQIITHELGHILGLPHLPSTEYIMYPRVQPPKFPKEMELAWANCRQLVPGTYDLTPHLVAAGRMAPKAGSSLYTASAKIIEPRLAAAYSPDRITFCQHAGVHK